MARHTSNKKMQNSSNSYPESFIKRCGKRVKAWLSGLSFRTGVVVLLCCVPCYVLSFAQMAFPISVAMKGILWFVLFGLAKCCQYGGLTILGVEGVRRLRAMRRRAVEAEKQPAEKPRDDGETSSSAEKQR